MLTIIFDSEIIVNRRHPDVGWLWFHPRYARWELAQLNPPTTEFSVVTLTTQVPPLEYKHYMLTYYKINNQAYVTDTVSWSATSNLGLYTDNNLNFHLVQ